MDIGNINSNLLHSLDLKSIFLGKDGKGVFEDTKRIESTVAASALSTVQNVAKTTSSSNTMSGNFAGDTSQSRYIEATMASFQAKQQMALRSHLILAAAAEEMLDANGIDRTNCGSAAGCEMEMRRIGNRKVLKESQKNLDAIKEKIEQGAQEAVAPKDENGNPIEGIAEPTESTTPMPEISIATSFASGETVPLIPAATIQATMEAAPQTPAPAPLRQSINIIV